MDEWALWALDQKINRRGIPVDIEFVDAAIRAYDTYYQDAYAEAKAITGLDNPNSRDQLLAWFAENGLSLEALDKEAVANALEGARGQVYDMLLLRKSLASNAVKKFYALQQAAPDGRLRGAFQFAGAERTKRWAGRLVQPHNLKRGFADPAQIELLVEATKAGALHWIMDDVPDVLSSLVRAAFAAPEGKTLVVADYASIESIVVAWLAEDDHLIRVFREGRDFYIDFAQHLFQCRYDEVTKAQRTIAKPTVLGAAYMLGAKGLTRYAAGMGVEMTEVEGKKYIDLYRAQYASIPELWETVTREAKRAILHPGTECQAGRVTFVADARFLFCVLPSGRRMAYAQPKIESVEMPWGGAKDAITYMGRNQVTRQWERIATHAGKLVENMTQAVARDVLGEGLLAVDAAGLDIVMHVHDEIVCEVDDARTDALEVMQAAMARSPSWAADLPLRSSGFTSRRYRKD